MALGAKLTSECQQLSYSQYEMMNCTIRLNQHYILIITLHHIQIEAIEESQQPIHQYLSISIIALLSLCNAESSYRLQLLLLRYHFKQTNACLDHKHEILLCSCLACSIRYFSSTYYITIRIEILHYFLIIKWCRVEHLL